MDKKVITSPAVHLFESSSEAYDSVNCGVTPGGAKVEDGDVLVVASEGVIGVATSAWPVAAVLDEENGSGSFHTLATNADVSCLFAAEEHKSTYMVHPDKGEPYMTTDVYPANPGVDYTASFKKARETAVEDADITGNDHWKEQ